jgi:glycine betaine transporter
MSDSSGGAFARFLGELDPVPFVGGAVATLLFVGVAAVRTDWVSQQLTTAFDVFGQGLAWLYLGSALALVAVGGYLMVSPYGRIRLGDGDPEYSYASYVAMFFSAGLSAGVVFFGPVEALTHYDTVPPLFDGVEAGTEAAMVPALAYSIFHYGVSAWGGYLAVGLPVAYYVHRRGAPFRVSTALLPVLGRDNLDGVVAKTVATLGGIATGLGFIATQLLTGVTYGTGIEFGPAETVVAVVGITVVFTASLLAGVDRGIRRLSDFNVAAMGVLLAATVLLGPTGDVLNTGVAAVGTYAGNFFAMSLFTGVGTDGGGTWSAYWTVFYWSWWIAWAPFVGLFLARISEGRTIREVLFTAFVTMTAVSVVWFTAVGGTSMWLQHVGAADILGPVAEFGDGVAGYALFGALPLGQLWGAVFLVLVVTFFATSADSSTLAVAMLTTGGKQSPSRLNRLFWGVLQGAVASVLVVLGGASALRSSVIVTGAPFAVVCLLAFGAFLVALGRDHGSAVFTSQSSWLRDPDSEDTDADRSPAATVSEDD